MYVYEVVYIIEELSIYYYVAVCCGRMFLFAIDSRLFTPGVYVLLLLLLCWYDDII